MGRYDLFERISWLPNTFEDFFLGYSTLLLGGWHTRNLTLSTIEKTCGKSDIKKGLSACQALSGSRGWCQLLWKHFGECFLGTEKRGVCGGYHQKKVNKPFQPYLVTLAFEIASCHPCRWRNEPQLLWVLWLSLGIWQLYTWTLVYIQNALLNVKLPGKLEILIVFVAWITFLLYLSGSSSL